MATWPHGHMATALEVQGEGPKHSGSSSFKNIEKCVLGNSSSFMATEPEACVSADASPCQQ